jgi:DNA-binding response OmpR family regulator
MNDDNAIKNLLLVDDDELNGELLKKRLEKRGFHCNYVASAREAFTAIELENFDMVLLDIMMPDISGMEALVKIREQKDGFELPIIMVTSKDEASNIVDALKAGANDYLTKPVNIEIAIARINTQITVKSAIDEGLKSKQMSTINKMVTTLNHEINNPLAIAIGNLSISYDKIDEARIAKALNALDRITQLVKKIDGIAKGDMEEVEYSNNVNMFKV